MKQHNKAVQGVTVQVKTDGPVTVQVKTDQAIKIVVTVPDLNKKTACPCCNGCKR